MPLLERAVAGNPSDSQSLVWLSRAYGVQTRAEDQRRAIERAYAIDPLSPLVLTNYAAISQSLGQRDLSERLLGEMAALNPDSATLYRLRSQVAMDDGRIDEAIRWASAGAKRHPDDAGLYDRLALNWSFLGDSERGLIHAARLRELTPDSAFAVSTEVLVRLNAGDRDTAALLLQSAAEGSGADRFLHFARAYYLMTVGDHDAALEAVLSAAPGLRGSFPPMGDWGTFSDAPMAAYLFRATGNVAQSRRIAEAFDHAVDAYWKPVDGPEMASTLVHRAQMAAVTGDHAALIDSLSRYHERGALLPNYIPREPWFQAYKKDPVIAGLFAKADARREEARRRLREEGL